MRLAFSVWAACLVACCCIPNDKKPASQLGKADGKTQEERKELIDRYKRLGVIEKVEGSSTGRAVKLHVRPAFHAVPLEDKKVIASLVFTWFFEIPLNTKAEDIPDDKRLDVIDHANGKEVGSFTPRFGLSMDK